MVGDRRPVEWATQFRGLARRGGDLLAAGEPERLLRPECRAECARVGGPAGVHVLVAPEHPRRVVAVGVRRVAAPWKRLGGHLRVDLAEIARWRRFLSRAIGRGERDQRQDQRRIFLAIVVSSLVFVPVSRACTRSARYRRAPECWRHVVGQLHAEDLGVEGGPARGRDLEDADIVEGALRRRRNPDLARTPARRRRRWRCCRWPLRRRRCCRPAAACRRRRAAGRRTRRHRRPAHASSPPRRASP